MGKKKVIAEFVKYSELIDYVENYLTHKRHLILIKESKAYTIAEDIASQINEMYPYEKDGVQPPIPKITIEKEIKKGHKIYKREYAFKDYLQYGRCLIVEDLVNESYDSLEAIVPKLIDSDILIIATLKSVKDLDSLPPSFLYLCKVFDLQTGMFLDKAVEKEIKSTTKNKNSKGAKGKDNFDDVKLKTFIDWKSNFSNSEYKFFVKYKKSPEQDLDLDDRFRPVLYRLVKGAKVAKTPNDYVSNTDLKKAFHPRKDIDDAKRNIVNTFVKIIGPRATEIIKIEQGKGNHLLIPGLFFPFSLLSLKKNY